MVSACLRNRSLAKWGLGENECIFMIATVGLSVDYTVPWFNEKDRQITTGTVSQWRYFWKTDWFLSSSHYMSQIGNCYILYIYKHLKFETFHTIVKITRSDFFGVVRQRPHQKPHLKNVGFFGKGPGLNPGSPGLSRCIICMHWYMKDLSLFLLIYNNYTSNLSAF